MSNDPNTQYILDRLEYAQAQNALMQEDCQARLDVATQAAKNCVNGYNTCQDSLARAKACHALDAGPETTCECVIDFSPIVKDCNTRLAFADNTVTVAKSRVAEVERWNDGWTKKYNDQTHELNACQSEHSVIVQPGMGREAASFLLMIAIGVLTLVYGGQLLWRWLDTVLSLNLERKRVELEQIKKMNKDMDKS